MGSNSSSGYTTDTRLRLQRAKGGLFEVLLVLASVLGLAALVVLFGFISFDALGPLGASPSWYIIYFATLVGPTGGYVLYVRQRPAVRKVNDQAFAAVVGGLVVSIFLYVVGDALSPYDVLFYFVMAALPPLLITLYAKYHPRRSWTGPAIIVSIVLGVGVGALIYDSVISIIEIAAAWIAFAGFTTVPALGITYVIFSIYKNKRAARRYVIGLAVGAILVVGVAMGLGIDPSFPLVLYSGAGVPSIVLVANVVGGQTDDGSLGLLGPVIVVSGIVAGGWLERWFGISGLETWVTPTLLLESWSSTTATEAGVYPQIVGSIVIISCMALLAFPIGVGAAIYLEEYAPDTGIVGRIGKLIEINIANLAGVPSVVYGLLGLSLFSNMLGLSQGIVIVAAATLGLLVLPIVIVSTQEAIRAVPDTMRMGSYGMGASRWQTLRNVVLPEALPGTLTGTILALGRAIGETAPLIIISLPTTRFSPPSGLFETGTALPLQIFAASASVISEYRYGVVAASSFVLLTLMLLMNGTAIVLRNRYEKR